MKQWQSILLTLTLAVVLIAGSISISFNVSALISGISSALNGQKQIVDAVNQINQRLSVLENKEIK